MLIPAAMNIESAAEMLKSVPAAVREAQLAELQSFGSGRARDLGASSVSHDFALGYELGLQTARAVLAGSVTLLTQGIEPEKLL